MYLMTIVIANLIKFGYTLKRNVLVLWLNEQTVLQPPMVMSMLIELNRGNRVGSQLTTKYERHLPQKKGSILVFCKAGSINE